MIYRVIALVTLAHVGAAYACHIAARALLGDAAPGVSRWIYLFLVVDAIVLVGMLERRAPLFGRIWWRGSVARAAVALTFDDGPTEPNTTQILDVLKRHGVKATFFVLGANAERHPDVVRRIVAEGHEIGNHTYDHYVLPLKGPGHIRSQIRRTSDLIERASGTRPTLFRPPHGWRNPFVDSSARAEGVEPVAWSLGVYDTDQPGPEVIRRRVRDGLVNGAVILLHDGKSLEPQPDASQVVQALPGIIADARQKGLAFETLSQMRAAEGGR